MLHVHRYISHKEHIHMNATCWSSLTGLCKYLGKEGKCVVDETEKGWYIQYIDKDPKLLAKQAALDKQQKADLNEEERIRRMIATQVDLANKNSTGEVDEEEEGSRNLVRPDGDGKVELKLANFSKAAGPLRPSAKTVKPVTFSSNDTFAGATSSTSTGERTKKSMSNIDALIAETERKKASKDKDEDMYNRKDYWLAEDIVVKVMNKKVGGGKFYKEKGIVTKVIDDYIGEVRLLSDNTKIRLDQEDLESVVPKVGQKGILLNGRCRGCTAEVLQINESAYNCDVKVLSSSSRLNGKKLLAVEYDDISKLA